LTLGLLYHPGFAEYADYDPAKAGDSMGPTDVGQYLLTMCATVDDVRAVLRNIRVVSVVEPVLRMTPPIHFIVVDPSGHPIVIEFLNGQPTIYDAPLGVLTNAPNYDWHIINLRNYINLSPVAIPDKKIEDLEFQPLGAGSGMIGLPGDFTPPSRFIRAVAFTATARKTEDGPETVYEMFRILDNFNLPAHAAEGSGQSGSDSKMRSSTIWTVATDSKNRVIYYHTQHNRRVRMIDAGKIDFDTLTDTIITRPLDKDKTQDIEEIDLFKVQ
jgi:choloylglycine hydrolase